MADVEFTCPHYRAREGSKLCESYQDGGTCAREEYFLCVEWEKRNQGHLATLRRRAADGTDRLRALEPAPAVDLFGNLVPEPKPPKAKKQAAKVVLLAQRVPLTPVVATESHAEPEDRPDLLRRGFTDEDIESFKALGVEICLENDQLGEVWLVPEYTDERRRELTPEHAATIARALEIFPGARVTAFEHRTPAKSQKENDEAG